jgi:hypothetical protein
VSTQEFLRSTGGEEVTGCDDASRSEPVETPTRFIRLRGPILPPSSDPSGVFKPVEYTVSGRAGQLCGLHDRPTMQLDVVVETLQEDLQDVQKWVSDPGWTRHSAYLT